MYDYGEHQPLPEELKNYKSFVEAQVANRRYFKRLRWFLLFALVALSGYLLDKRPETISLDKAFLALGITWLGFLPSLQYLLDRNRPPIPCFPLVGLFYATSFGLPMFASDLKLSGQWSLGNVSDTALILALMGVAGMNIAFFFSKFSLWKYVSPVQLRGPYPLGKLRTILWLLLLSHTAFLYIPFIQAVPSIGQILDPVGYVAYGMFYIIWSRGNLPPFQLGFLLGIFVPLEIIKRFASGLLAELMVLGLFMVIIVWSERKRIPIVFISITLLIYLAFSPVKNEYRNATWWSKNNTSLTVLDKAELFVDLAVKHYQKNNIFSQNKSSQDSTQGSLVSRSAHIITFSQVIKDTPSRVPYWNGETYLPIFTSYIPRIFWPDKPVLTTGNSFGRRYNYLDKTDETTSFNLPLIVEMYANFGSLGVLIGMPLLGLLLAFLEQKFNRSGMTSLEVTIGATVLFRLIYQESSLSLLTGSIINISLALYCLFKIFLSKSRSAPHQ